MEANTLITMEDWMKSSWLFQQEAYKTLGKRKWDDLNNSEENLKKKLVIPFHYCFGNKYKDIPEFKKVTDHIEVELLKLFNEKCYNARFNCTYINLMKKDNNNEVFTNCIFWLQSENGSVRCLDFQGRNYESWEDFFNNNVLPKCYMIYPKNFIYYHENNNNEEFAEIVLDESVACGTSRTIKKIFNTIATFGGMAAAGVLVSNPVSGPVILGAAAVTSVSGVYGTANSIFRLVDIHKHDGGLSLTDSKTLLAGGELVLNVAGTAAIGLSAGIKGFTASTGKVLPKGSLAFKIGNNFCNVTKVVSCCNAGFNIILVVNNYRINGHVSRDDVLIVGKVLFYAYNIFAEELVLSRLITFLGDNFRIEDIFEYFASSPLKAATVVSDFYKFCSENDVYKLIEMILPDFIKRNIPKCIDIIPMVQIAINIVQRFVSNLKKGELSLDYLFSLQIELKFLWNKYCLYRAKNEFELRNKSDIASNYIKECTLNNGIDLFKKDSKLDSKINSLFEIEQRIKSILKICCRYDEETRQFEIKEKFLFSLFCNLAKRGGLKDDIFFVNKMNFLCSKFESLYKNLITLFNYEYFFYKSTVDENISKTNFFLLPHYNISDLREYVFMESMNGLKANINHFLHEFENEFQCIQPDHKRKERIIIEFTIPNCCRWLSEEQFYKKSQELLPKLGGKLNKISTTFDNYECFDMAIIRSKQNEFIIFFYVMIEENNLKGVLLLDENLSD